MYVATINRDSDIMRWCDFSQLTSCRIRSHNQRKNRIIAQFGEKDQFCKMYSNSNIILTMYLIIF